MGWVIQEIGPSEAGRLVPLFRDVHEIHAKARPDVFRAGPDPAALLKVLEEMFARNGMTALAAVGADGAVLGYALYEVEWRAATPLETESRWAELHHIAVAPERRRQGIGTALVEAMRARLRAEGVATMRTGYWTFNHASAALMRKAGFAPHYVHATASV